MPLYRHKSRASTPPPEGDGHGVATSRARSVPVVPPDFDGLLRACPWGFVAPPNRSWGSRRFSAGPVRMADLTDTSPHAQDPSKPFPSRKRDLVTERVAASVHRVPSPRAVGVVRAPMVNHGNPHATSTSGACSVGKSVARRWLPTHVPDAPLGFSHKAREPKLVRGPAAEAGASRPTPRSGVHCGGHHVKERSGGPLSSVRAVRSGCTIP